MKYPIELACIIDDDDMYVNLITKVIDFRKLSKNLLVFRNGKEALDYFVSALKNMERREIPEVILLDLNMPVMDGWQFLNELSKYDFKELNKTTLYIVSSSINPADIERSKAISMVKDFLVKPIRPNEIAEVFMTENAS
jgi:CheY-like chemotaxis protein